LIDKGKNKIRLTKLEKINSHAGSIIHTLQKIKVEKYYKKREKNMAIYSKVNSKLVVSSRSSSIDHW